MANNSKCLCSTVSGFPKWNKNCPLHGLYNERKVTDSGLAEKIVSLMNEFYWSATVPKFRLQELLNRVEDESR